MSKKLIKKVKKIFINAVCAHSGPEYFLEHMELNGINGNANKITDIYFFKKLNKNK